MEKHFLSTKMPSSKISIHIGNGCFIILGTQHKYVVTQRLRTLTSHSINKELVGSSLSTLRRDILKVAPTDIPVMILGDTGTGKEIIARMIHEVSRPGRPFVAVNCASIADSFSESELFGHNKVHSTGRRARVSWSIRASSARNIIFGRSRRIEFPNTGQALAGTATVRGPAPGGSGNIDIDVRVISATNADVLNRIKEGTSSNRLVSSIEFCNSAGAAFA